MGRRRDYIRDVSWVTDLGGVYSGGLIYGGRINRFNCF